MDDDDLQDIFEHLEALDDAGRSALEKSFSGEFKLSIAIELASSRRKMAAALIRGGLKPGPGQPAMQKLYWQLIGDVRELLEVSGPGGPIPLNDSTPIPLEMLSLHTKCLIAFEISGGKISAQLADGIIGEIEGAQLGIRPDYKLVCNG